MAHNRRFRAAFLLLSFGLSTNLVAKDKVAVEEITQLTAGVAPRQLIVLKPGVDVIFGTWVAAVINKSKTPQHVRLSALIPRETNDVQPVEGLTNGDWKLDETGLWVEKEFPEGVNVISFVFRTAAKFGVSQLNFKAGAVVSELLVMTPTGMLDITAPNLVITGTDTHDAQGYTVRTLQQPIASGEALVLEVEGVPEGRARLWFVGAAFGLLMLGGAAVLAWRTRNKSFSVDV